MQRTGKTAFGALAALAFGLLLSAGCGGEPDQGAAKPGDTAKPAQAAPERSAEEIKADYEESFAAFNAEEDPEKKSRIVLDFLERNPDSDYTMRALSYLAGQYYIGQKNDYPGAVALIEEHLKSLTGERVNQARAMLISIHGKAGNIDKLREMSAEIDADGEMNYAAHLTFAHAAITAQAWSMAVEHAQAALDSLTPDAVRAAYPDREMSDEVVANRVKNYKNAILIALGRAQMGNGDIDAALTSFSAAGEFELFNYVGVPGSDINVYWAKALIAKGDYDAAMRRIAPDAILQGKEGAMDIFREAYTMSGDESGLEAAIENMRAGLARPVEEFEAYTYKGDKVAWSAVKGRVTYLSFWFPT